MKKADSLALAGSIEHTFADGRYLNQELVNKGFAKVKGAGPLRCVDAHPVRQIGCIELCLQGESNELGMPLLATTGWEASSF